MKKVIKIFKNRIFRICTGGVLFAAALIVHGFGMWNLALALDIAALLISGAPVFVDAARGILRRDLLDEKFLMSVASIGAFFINEWSEGVAVMLFFLIGETFEKMAVKRSRNSIRSLMSIRPDEARVLTDTGEITVDADEVKVGNTVIIRPGERVPVDCLVVSGSADADTSAMTGESIPRSVKAGDTLDSGIVIINGMLRCECLRPAEESAASRILELVENASESKSKEENFITKFSHFYTPIVVISAVLLAVLLPIFKIAPVDDAIRRALMFLVISCPCALVISVPMAFFGGIGGAASRGILYKGGNVFSRVARADTVAFDKTGTLTNGKFKVRSVISYGVSKETVINYAAAAEQGSNHPIAKAVAALRSDLPTPKLVKEFTGEGIIASVDGHTVAVGNSALMKRARVTVNKNPRGTVLVSLDGELIGELIISDKVKPNAPEALHNLSLLGVRRMAIISGDKAENVKAVADKLSITEAYYELTPEQKYDKLRELTVHSRSTVFVGDGINDAPALATADVGIAMGGIGQDSAIEAADVVIMADDLGKIPEAIKIARRTIGIAKFNIFFALGVKLLILFLGALGLTGMWLAVFADVGVAVLAILNSMRTLARSNMARKWG